VRILLDTHVFLWLAAQPERLGPQLSILEDPRAELLLSAASSWEIAIKHGLGRLELPQPPRHWVPQQMRRVGAGGVAVEHAHALAVADLPPVHRDPFDRLLVVTSRSLRAALLTADPVFAGYDVDLLRVDRP
jgi:PIN domain nuclease of toxin-antitoxin system